MVRWCGVADGLRLSCTLQKYGAETASMLDGKFSFVVYDDKNKRIYAGRDHMGICPMYIGYGKDGSVWFASEMKASPAAGGAHRLSRTEPRSHTLSALSGRETALFSVRRSLGSLPCSAS